MTKRTINFTATTVSTTGDYSQLAVAAENVDVTDFLDAEMAVEELDAGDLLDTIGADNVAEWLRGEGYEVSEN